VNASVVFHYVRQRRAGHQLNPVSYVVVPVIGAVICAYLLSQLDSNAIRCSHGGAGAGLRMPGVPWLTVLGLVIVAAIFTVGFIGENSRPQFLSTCALVALLANWLHHRSGKVPPVVEYSEPAKPPALVD
jgi:AAT family amino acid transporter